MKFISVFFVLVVAAQACIATEIRVRNDSDSVFTYVVVGGKPYGTIQPHTTTDYQHWKLAYHSASVSLVAGSNPIIIQPADYLREGELGEGKYTYVLRFKSGVLRIYAERDAE